jgi:hypothetical protein
MARGQLTGDVHHELRDRSRENITSL